MKTPIDVGDERRHVQRLYVSSLVLALALLACGSPPVRMGDRRTEPEPSTTCPSGIPGARIRMVETDDGIAFVLKAFGDVHDVRRRAHDAAAMYGPGAHRGRGHEGTHGSGQQHGLALDRLGVPVVVETTDTAEGARIVVRPKDPADLPKLREAATTRESRVRAGDC